MFSVVFVKLGYSLSGIRDTYKTEASFRQWLFLVLISNTGALVWAPNRVSILLVVAFGFLLLAAELINTALEAIVDKTTPDFHPLAKKAKDAGSAMTFVTFLGLGTIWVQICLDIFQI